MVFFSFIEKINGLINKHAEKYSHPYLTFAIFGIVTYPLYYVVWKNANAVGYENLSLRLIAVVLCVFLAIKKYWPNNIQKFFAFYWYLTLTYSLPFLFTFLILKNNLSDVWVMNTTTVLVLCILLLDLMSLSIVLLVGIICGIIFYIATGGNFTECRNYINIFIIYGSILVFGSLFSFRKDQLEMAEKKIKSKEAERLKLENKAHIAEIESQRKFTKIASQVAHDIRSPLASLLMIVKACDVIPEKERIALRDAVGTIDDIANHLLSQYKSKNQYVDKSFKNKESVLVSATLLQLLTDKKYQYNNKDIQFIAQIQAESQFAFISINKAFFTRMLSNLINNSVEALLNSKGIIEVFLKTQNSLIIIIIKDNGSGMTQEVLDKIMSNDQIFTSKTSGYGLGLSQVKEVVDNNNGKMNIKSQMYHGTEVIIELPRIKAPAWIAEKIILTQDCEIIILDDDKSIHVAWETRFRSILNNNSGIKINHWTNYIDVYNYISSLSVNTKEKIILLTDYELVNQKYTGLDLILKTKIKNAILVTSHYIDLKIQKLANKLKIKILPKQLASEVEIFLKEEQKLKTVDAIWLDDDVNFIKNLRTYLFVGYAIDYYIDPKLLIEKMYLYSKDTKIYLDNDLGYLSDYDGLGLANILYEQGFTNISIISGNVLELKNAPEYFQVYLKTEVDKIKDSWVSR